MALVAAGTLNCGGLKHKDLELSDTTAWNHGSYSSRSWGSHKQAYFFCCKLQYCSERCVFWHTQPVNMIEVILSVMHTSQKLIPPPIN